jgi:murein DD-endopeptidase MepM/ murein hydrolase activator NlpD
MNKQLFYRAITVCLMLGLIGPIYADSAQASTALTSPSLPTSDASTDATNPTIPNQQSFGKVALLKKIWKIPQKIKTVSQKKRRLSVGLKNIPERRINSKKAPWINNPALGKIKFTSGYMEQDPAHTRKKNIKAIFGDGESRNLPLGNYNQGIDYTVADGRVRAFYDGVVVSTLPNRGYGNQIKVKTNALYKYKDLEYPIYTAYSHLANLKNSLGQMTRTGDRIEQGQDIATEGNTGHSKGHHVDLRTWIEVDGQQIEVSPNALEKYLDAIYLRSEPQP